MKRDYSLDNTKIYRKMAKAVADFFMKLAEEGTVTHKCRNTTTGVTHLCRNTLNTYAVFPHP
jgi:hypothetical protein